MIRHCSGSPPKNLFLVDISMLRWEEAQLCVWLYFMEFKFDLVVLSSFFNHPDS